MAPPFLKLRSLKSARLVWTGLTFLHLVTYLLARFYIGEIQQQEGSIQTGYLLGSLAILCGGLSWYSQNMAIRQRKVRSFMVLVLLSLVLAQSIHFYGLIGLFMGLEMNAYASFALLAFVFHSLYFPVLPRARTS